MRRRIDEHVRPGATALPVFEPNDHPAATKLRAFVQIDVGETAVHVGSEQLVYFAGDARVTTPPVDARIAAEVVQDARDRSDD